MNKLGLASLIRDLNPDHQVNRIIQLDKTTGYAFIPVTIMQAAALELVFKGSVSYPQDKPQS